MKFIFVCPTHGKNFASDAFHLENNNGVKTDVNGQKYLDADVTLHSPCPHCGATHTFAARELACPFEIK